MPDRASPLPPPTPLARLRRGLSDHIRQVVYGGNDGIVTTFAVVAGFAGAEADGAGQIGAIAVLVFGLANLFADATSMGLGEFLSDRSARSRWDVARARLRDHDGLADALADRGMDGDDARTMAAILARNPGLQADLALRFLHGLDRPPDGSSMLRAAVTFVSFLAFGVIPLSPYLAGGGPEPETFAISVAATGVALVLLGLLRWRATGATAARAVGETVAVGGFCALVAYIVGALVGG
jgi:VIT1/CCC1 family predicted Fe2+/Mn2+ transporter